MKIEYLTEEYEKLFDRSTIKRLLGITKSKLHRELKKNNLKEKIKYKNQHLYCKQSLFALMEIIMIEKFIQENGLSKNK
jgi:hypothetical protein